MHAKIRRDLGRFSQLDHVHGRCGVVVLGDLVVTSAESKPSPLHPSGGFLLISACRFECVWSRSGGSGARRARRPMTDKACQPFQAISISESRWTSIWPGA